MLVGSYGGYDWGSEEKNLLHHGSPVPPSYSLKNVTAKVSPTFFVLAENLCFLPEFTLRQVALVWGDNDVLVEAEDLKRIKDEVPNIVMNFKASYTLYAYTAERRDVLRCTTTSQYILTPGIMISLISENTSLWGN